MRAIEGFSPPEFDISVINHVDGSPDTISITPIKRGGILYDEEQTFMEIAKTLQSTVIDAITKFIPAFSQNSLGNVNGILQMNNINDYRHAHTEDVNLGKFGTDDIQDIFERVVGYGEITIYDVSFSFWINPLSLKEGTSNHV